MTTDRPRRLAAATLALAVSAGLAGCHTGFDAATSKQYQQGVGANQRDGDVRLHNALLVENSDGTFSFSGGLVNTTDEEQVLTSASFVPLSGEGASPLETKPSPEIAIAPQGAVNVGAEGELAGLEIDGLEKGRYVTITFTFNGNETSVEAPVVARTALYADVAEESAAAAKKRERQQEQAAEEEGAADQGLQEGATDGATEEPVD